MNTNLTDITLVIDRSGSMESVKQEATNGVNAFIKEQKEQPGDAVLTLVQFDTEYEFLHKGTPIKDVPDYELISRGMTALLDAVGRSINEAGERLSKMREEDRPGLVVFVILTDGKENSSHEFSNAQIKEMVKHQQDAYNWQFTFLGANPDAFAGGMQLGFDPQGAAQYKDDKVASALKGTSGKLRRMRSATARGQAVSNRYTDEELKKMS